MLISAREAAPLLRPLGLSRERARLVLATGIAGAGVRTAGALLYDEDRVRTLAARPPLTPGDITAACPHGVFVARLGPGHRLDLTLDAQARLEPASGPWAMALAVWATVRAAAFLGRSIPLLATVGGVVVQGAEILDAHGAGEAGYRLVLDEPGRWCEPLLGRRWLPGRGGPPLLAWGWSARLATG